MRVFAGRGDKDGKQQKAAVGVDATSKPDASPLPGGVPLPALVGGGLLGLIAVKMIFFGQKKGYARALSPGPLRGP